MIQPTEFYCPKSTSTKRGKKGRHRFKNKICSACGWTKAKVAQPRMVVPRARRI